MLCLKKADRRVSMGRRGKIETGTCNVCSAPCSSCMHRNASSSGSKSGESSEENSRGVVASQCSFNEEGRSSQVNNAIGSSHNTASEAGNLVNSNNDTSSENDESASNDSDVLELDVKVCDICGDAGREDLLAICGRCSDGAEHTYCMRVMAEKVPQGDWFCDECKFTEDAEKKLEAKRKKETEANLNTQSSSKRHIDKLEAAPDAKRQAVQSPTGSPKKPVLPRLAALSRETSFKGSEKKTRKLAHHSSFKSHYSDDTQSTRSTDSQPQSPKGSLLKSNSFTSSSSRPKVRPVDDVMHKDVFSKNAGIDLGSSDCNASKTKGPKQVKDRSTEANPAASTVDQKLISRGSSYANSARDSKGLQSDGKQGSLTKQGRHLSRNRLEDIVTSGGDTSTNENCSSSEQISTEAKRKDELGNLEGLPRSSEFREVGEKSKVAVGKRQRSELLSVSKGLISQKVQNAEPTETLCAPGNNLSITRNIREDTNKGNKLRAAVDAALRKKPSFSKNRGLEQSVLPSVSDVDSNCDKAFQSVPLKVPVVRDWPVGLQGGHPNLQTEKQTTAVNGKQVTPAVAADAVAASQSVESEVHLPSVNPVMRDLPVAATSVLSTTSAIPEPEYIWQGDMEVQKSRNLTAMHCAIQAYLSTIASPKVVEAVKQFPVKVNLNEVPRLSTWPAQFQDVGATEDNVALFFFAKDVESYAKSYKPLVDNMIQNDLALKGTLEGVELLIFTSNQLPQNCQHWNTLLFLWGVFRGKKEKCSIPLKNIPLPATNVLPNMGKAFSTLRSLCHDITSNRDSSTDRASSRMQTCMKENPKEDEACGVIDMEIEETEEGEIGFTPGLRDKKITGAKRVNSSDMNRKVDMGDLSDEGLCEGPVNKKLKTGTGVETVCSISRMKEHMIKKNPNATERFVFPLDLNDGKEDDDEMVDNERRSVVMVPNLKLALGEENTTTTGAGTSSIEEHRSGKSHKPQEEDAASMSLSLSFSTVVEKGQERRIGM
ncbi:unnamed protein product [Cochlearia groenlandica]